MEEKKNTLRSRAWNYYFNWSEKYGMLGEFIPIYVVIMLVQIPIDILAPDTSFLLKLTMLLPVSFFVSYYRGKYIDLERNKRFLTEVKTLQEKRKNNENLKKIREDEESLKVEEGKVCVAVCRGCDVRIYTGDKLHKGKDNYCFCQECKPTI